MGCLFQAPCTAVLGGTFVVRVHAAGGHVRL